MQVYEFRSKLRDPRERGRAYGEAFGEAICANAQRYQWGFAELGVEHGVVDRVVAGAATQIAAWAPSQWAELEGIAEASGASIDELVALTARTEILAHSPEPPQECSTVALVREGHLPMGMQTWDWHAELAPEGMMLEFVIDDRTVRTFTEVGMLGKIGTAGNISMFFNILQHEADVVVDYVGVPVHTVARGILDAANTLDDAIRIAESAKVSASTVITVLEAASANYPNGRAASIELSPVGVGVVSPDEGVLVHTNHFLHPDLANGDASTPASTTQDRYEHLQDARGSLTAARSVHDLASAMCGDEGASAPVCMRPKESVHLADRWQSTLR